MEFFSMMVRRRISLIRTSIRALGLSETMKAVLVHLLVYRPHKDSSFDKQYGTDTAAEVLHHELDIRSDEAKKNATWYVSAPPRFDRYILGQLGINYSDYEFVDLGCGKGRVLIVASEFSFRGITGVEISPSLSEVARKNLTLYASASAKWCKLSVHCMDARDYPVPTGKVIYYMYHPFEVLVLKAVLDNISSSLRDHGGEVLVIYVWLGVYTLFPLFEERAYTRIKYERTANERWQYAVFRRASSSQ